MKLASAAIRVSVAVALLLALPLASGSAGAAGEATITRIAGGGDVDGLAALESPIGRPVAVAAGADGVYFIVESAVRVLGPDGVVRTLAGSWRPGFADGPGDVAMFAWPQNLAVGPDGTVYVADPENDRIRAIDPNTGVVRTVAGDGDRGFTGDGMQATQASLGKPTDVAVDAAGRIYIAEQASRRIRRVDLDGTIRTVAGNGDGARAYEGTAATGPIPRPYALDVGSDGSVYFTELPTSSDTAPYSFRVMKVDPQARLWTIAALEWATTPHVPVESPRDEGLAPSAFTFHGYPQSIVELDDVVYVLDGYNGYWQGAIWRVSRPAIPGVEASRTTSRYAARGGCFGFEGDGGPATDACFDRPYDIAIGPSGDFYVADTFNRRIRRIDAPTQVIDTIAGNGVGQFQFAGDGLQATNVRLATPCGVASDPAGNVYVSDFLGSESLHQVGPRIRRISPDGTISTVAGNGLMGFADDGESAAESSIAPTCGVAYGGGSIYFSEFMPDPEDPFFGEPTTYVKRVDLATGTIQRFAGTGENGYSGDGGPARQAQLPNPQYIAVAPDGTVYISTWGDNRIRAVAPGGVIRTVAGNGSAGFSGDGGPATQASLDLPAGMVVAPDGDLVFADLRNHVIRRIDADTGVIRTVAGDGNPDTDGIGYGDGGHALSASLRQPIGVALDEAGNLYISDSGHRRIRVVRPDGTIHGLACSGASPAGRSVADGAALAARCAPQQISIAPDGDLVFADTLFTNGSFDVSLVRSVDLPGQQT